MPSSNIFPTDFYYSGINNKETDEIPMLFDYLIDLNTGALIFNEYGQATIITQLDALITQVWRAINTKRGECLAYTQNYGCRLHELNGQGKSLADCLAYDFVCECILKDSHLGKYIKKIQNFSTEFDHGKYSIYFEMDTIYGTTPYYIHNLNFGVD